MEDIFNLQPNKIPTNLGTYPMIWLSEDTGDGKSYSMNLFLNQICEANKKPLFIMLEDRYQMIPNIMAVRVRSIPELMSLIAKLKTPKAKELYSCIVIDTIDKLDSMLENYVATSKEVEITAELGFGKGNLYVKGKLFMLDDLKNNGWVVHSIGQCKKVVNFVNNSVSFEPKVNKELWAKLAQDAYFIGMITKDPKSEERLLTFKKSAKYPALKDSNNLPLVIKLADLKKTIENAILKIEGATFTDLDTINEVVISKVDIESLKVRGKELGSMLANVGRVEEALNILRVNLGVADEKTKTPNMLDSLLPTQIELAQVVVLELEGLCSTYKLI